MTTRYVQTYAVPGCDCADCVLPLWWDAVGEPLRAIETVVVAGGVL